ncbi:MAG: hypothetical protein ACYCTI_13970, partial [Acidimicrobiales bacterium]
YGGTLPAETWADYMGAALKGVPPTNFAQPPVPVRPPSVFAVKSSIAAGYPDSPTPLGSGQSYLFQPPPPSASAPTTTTSTSSTTTTTAPGSSPTSSTLVPPGPAP